VNVPFKFAAVKVVVAGIRRYKVQNPADPSGKVTVIPAAVTATSPQRDSVPLNRLEAVIVPDEKAKVEECTFDVTLDATTGFLSSIS
jgi:hypothetical protein